MQWGGAERSRERVNYNKDMIKGMRKESVFSIRKKNEQNQRLALLSIININGLLRVRTKSDTTHDTVFQKKILYFRRKFE